MDKADCRASQTELKQHHMDAYNCLDLKRVRAGEPALFFEFFCSLSDWPTSWDGTLRPKFVGVNSKSFVNCVWGAIKNPFFSIGLADLWKNGKKTGRVATNGKNDSGTEAVTLYFGCYKHRRQDLQP